MAELEYPETQSRSRVARWFWLNVGAALALVALMLFFDPGIYLRFLELGVIAAFGFAIAVPVLVVWIFKNQNRDSAKLVWATFGLVLLLGLGAAAIFDAQQLQYHNCWVLNRQDGGSVRYVTFECVPGSAPEQGEWYSEATNSGTFASCELLNETSSRGTIWRCRYDDF